MSHKELWISVLRRLKPTIQKAYFLTWLNNTIVLDKQGGKIFVGVPNPYSKTWLEEKIGIKVLQAVQEVDSEIKEVVYEVHTRLGEKGNEEGINVQELLMDESEKKVRKVRNANEVKIVVGTGPEQSIVSSKILNNRYSLNNFIVGRDNTLPHAACQAVARMPGGIYNPLYIYGSTGMGKTHLLHAVGNEILKNFPDKTVKYLTAEKFVTELVEAIGRRHMKGFKDQYRNVDCLLVDDVQFFARKETSQEEFFHTFNELYERNRQIIITSDRSPKELGGLDQRLTTRFGMGMVVELTAPEFETRVAILNQKCQEFQTLIAPEVLNFIATNVSGSVRELEGVLRQAVAEAELANRVPTIRSVAEIIKKLNKAQELIGIDIENKKTLLKARTALDVMNAVVRYYNLTLEALTGPDRHKEVMMPRQICMYLIKNELGESYERIGQGFGGRNHTTVMHACNRTAEMLKKNVRMVRDINVIKHEMGM